MASWDDLGQQNDPLGGLKVTLLGASWGSVGGPWAPFGVSPGALGILLGPLGALVEILGRLGCQKGGPGEPKSTKIDPKKHQKFDAIFKSSKIALGDPLGPSWSDLRAKTGAILSTWEAKIELFARNGAKS